MAFEWLPRGDKLGMFTSHWPLQGLVTFQQSGRSVKTMNAKNMKKSPIHENADANITCEFGDGGISRFRSRLPHGHIVSSIIGRLAVEGKSSGCAISIGK